MKQYDRFGEYMFDLLFAPLKKGKRAINQFYIFFKVVGRIFDNLKVDALRVRDETNIATASPIMLPIHGQDRNMPRLAGENVEAYRTRRAMKGIISEWGGTRQGILYVLASLGYAQSRVEPYGRDQNHWAEFSIYMEAGNPNAIKNLEIVFHEIQKVKEGSSRLVHAVIANKPSYSTLRIGGRMAAVTRLPVPEEADGLQFSGALHLGGAAASVVCLPVPAAG